MVERVAMVVLQAAGTERELGPRRLIATDWKAGGTAVSGGVDGDEYFTIVEIREATLEDPADVVIATLAAGDAIALFDALRAVEVLRAARLGNAPATAGAEAARDLGRTITALRPSGSRKRSIKGNPWEN